VGYIHPQNDTETGEPRRTTRPYEGDAQKVTLS
jgi:hypothetical protein